jgi:RecB family exonuclease
VITPRVTRLVRVPDLRALQAAVGQLVSGQVAAVRRTAVVVPTRGAAEELRRTLEDHCLSGESAIVLPELVTRSDLYERLHAASPGLPRRLSPQEREVLLRRAARGVAAGTPPPFSLRPGLVLEMLRFYDELRRREQSLDDFSRLATSQLEPHISTDRGAERLLRQTEFLSASFAEFERLTHDTGAIDEHGLRTLLLGPAGPEQTAFTQLIVTVGDETADPRGLYGSDFDLLARMGGVERLEIVCTEHTLASGFHERVHQLLPGLEEVRYGAPSPPATLVVPEAGEDARAWFTSRDREEELADFVRDLCQRSAGTPPQGDDPTLDRCAVLFQRPLPYLYLARQVFTDAGLPYQTVDTLPLSAEPFSAAIDLVLSFLTAEGNRASTIALLSSPHFSFGAGAASVAALESRMREGRFSGGWDRLASMEVPEAGAEALSAAITAADALSDVRLAASASAQFGALLGFVRRFERLPPENAEWGERHLRARGAILAAIESLRDAHARHDGEPLDLGELSGSLRRWIEAQTFAPRSGSGGVRLLDASSAAYANVDELRVLGLVERDWPEPVRRSIFYPSSILSQLGWPPDAERSAAARARFRDLLGVATRRVSASAFTLEDDALVSPSPFVEELETAGLSIDRARPQPPAAVFTHEALWRDEPVTGSALARLEAGAAGWLTLRASRTASDDERYRGALGARAAKTYAVSYVERYLECPFKYYASQVLRLAEEREEEPGLTPQERGHFIHEVFEQFFAEWQRAGLGTITTANVADAILMFEEVVEARLEHLPEADRAMERTHLLGSAAASGLAERAFAFEMEQGGEVVERLLERSLEGRFAFASPDGERQVAIRAKADRIDLMADGTLRVIDYKLGRAPKPARALQLAVYGVCAEQALDGHRGRSWKLERAGYVAFKEKDAFVSLGGRSLLATALKEGQARFLAAIDAIERGEFPVRPDEPFRCQWCGYAGICRKDYVGDE